MGTGLSARALEIVSTGTPAKIPVVIGLSGDTAPLRNGIQRCTGVAPIVQTGTYSPVANGVPIYVGSGTNVTSRLDPAQVASLDAEGYIIKVTSSEVVIYGRNPGVTDTGTPLIWAQFDFLWRFLDAGAFFPGTLGEVYPPRSGLTVPEGTWVEQPAFLHRHWSGFTAGVSVPYGWRVRGSGGGGRFKFHHNLYTIFPTATYGSTHPEYYPVIYTTDPASTAGINLTAGPYVGLQPNQRYVPPSGVVTYWQPNLTNADVIAITKNAAISAINASPNNPVFSLGMNDSHGYCHCETCRASTPSGYSPYSREADGYRFYEFYNTVASAVYSGITDPNVQARTRLGFLAYGAANSWPPDGVELTLHPILMPYVTQSMADCWDASYKAGLTELYNHWAGWATHFGIYEYLYGYGFIIPRLYLHDLSEGLSLLDQLDCDGFYAEAYPNWGLSGPQLWVLEKLLWNPDQNVDDLIDEWCAGLFGSAGPAMRAYFDRLEQAWTEQTPGNSVRGGYRLWGVEYKNQQLTEIFSPAVCDAAWNLLLAAEQQTVDATALSRIRYFKQTFALTRYFSRRNSAANTANALKFSVAANLATAVNAYAVWKSAGDFDTLTDDLAQYTTQQNSPAAPPFYEQASPVPGGDWKASLKRWDSEFNIMMELGAAVVDLAVQQLGGQNITRVSLDNQIATIVNGLTADTGARADIINYAKAMVISARPVSSPPIILGRTFLNEQFADGERIAMSLPTSTAWCYGYSGTGTVGVSGTSGKLILEATARGQMQTWMYFTGTGPQSLDVGDSISVSFDFDIKSGSCLPITDPPGLRFGLFDSSTRVTADLPTSLGHSNWNFTKGYSAWINANTSTSQASSLRERAGGNMELMSEAAHSVLTSSSPAFYLPYHNTDSPPFTTLRYKAVFSVSRTGSNQVVVSGTWIRNSDSGVIWIMSGTDTSSIVTGFDTFALYTAPNMAKDFAIANVMVNHSRIGVIGPDWGATPSFSGSFYAYPSLSKKSEETTRIWLCYDNNFLYLAGRFTQPGNSFNSSNIGHDTAPLRVDGSGVLDISNYQSTFQYIYPSTAQSPPATQGVIKCNSFGVTLPDSSANRPTTMLGIMTAEGGIFDAYTPGAGYKPAMWEGLFGPAHTVWRLPDGWACQMKIDKALVGGGGVTGYFPLTQGKVLKGVNFFRISANAKTAWVPGTPSGWSISPATIGYVLFE